jgi:uncharacterized membrane protein YeaQ/YmgE (transglycosylase-associated protein family)
MTAAEIIGWLVIGLIVGLIARFLTPGRDPMGCVATTLLGVVGAIVGGYLSRLFFPPEPGLGFVRPGFFISLIGAILVLLVVRLFRRRPVA